jgi:hypothetical protein
MEFPGLLLGVPFSEDLGLLLAGSSFPLVFLLLSGTPFVIFLVTIAGEAEVVGTGRLLFLAAAAAGDFNLGGG